MESLYKVGDVVKIKQLSIDDDSDYRFGVNTEMVKQSGKTFEIERVSSTMAFEGIIPDDGFCYKLKGIGWSWASSMFEESKKTAKSKSKKSEIKISFHKKKEVKFNFSL